MTDVTRFEFAISSASCGWILKLVSLSVHYCMPVVALHPSTLPDSPNLQCTHFRVRILNHDIVVSWDTVCSVAKPDLQAAIARTQSHLRPPSHLLFANPTTKTPLVTVHRGGGANEQVVVRPSDGGWHSLPQFQCVLPVELHGKSCIHLV